MHGPWGVQYAPLPSLPTQVAPLGGGLCMHNASVRALFSPYGDCVLRGRRTRTNSLTEILVSR